MEAASIYFQTLSQLDETELAMTSPAGDALIQAASPANRPAAAQMILSVHQARLALGNANLQSIADKLKTNEGAIEVGTAAVKVAVTALGNLTEILNTVSALTGCSGKTHTDRLAKASIDRRRRQDGTVGGRAGNGGQDCELEAH